MTINNTMKLVFAVIGAGIDRIAAQWTNAPS